jgi:ferritin-like metal-binding protein YciE
MRLFSGPTFNSLEDLFLEQIGDLYDAEKRLVQALPKMSGAAHEPRLKTALQEHLRETEGQVRRLEEVFRLFGKEASRETCAAMRGLISEGDDMVSADGDPMVKDAAIIAAAQRVEHYEISGYGSARNFARRIGREDIAKLLQQTLDEEKSADAKLTRIAEESVNPSAQRKIA